MFGSEPSEGPDAAVDIVNVVAVKDNVVPGAPNVVQLPGAKTPENTGGSLNALRKAHFIEEVAAAIGDTAVGKVAVYYLYIIVSRIVTAEVALEHHFRRNQSLAVVVQRYVEVVGAAQVGLRCRILRNYDKEIFLARIAKAVRGQ